MLEQAGDDGQGYGELEGGASGEHLTSERGKTDVCVSARRLGHSTFNVVARGHGGEQH